MLVMAKNQRTDVTRPYPGCSEMGGHEESVIEERAPSPPERRLSCHPVDDGLFMRCGLGVRPPLIPDQVLGGQQELLPALCPDVGETLKAGYL
jgi:hypothetical protein